MNTLLWLPAYGFVVGVLTSMVGGGGGVFYMALLVGSLHMSVITAASTSLAVMLPSLLAATWSHYRQGRATRSLLVPLLAGGVVGVVVAFWLAPRVSPDALAKFFALFLLALAVGALTRTVRSGTRFIRLMREFADRRAPAAPVGQDAEWPSVPTWQTVSVGAIGAIIYGLFGSSGAMPVTSWFFRKGVPVPVISAHSIPYILVVTALALVSHLLIGPVPWSYVAYLACGSVAGSYIGPRLLPRIPSFVLDPAWGVIVTFACAWASLKIWMA